MNRHRNLAALALLTAALLTVACTAAPAPAATDAFIAATATPTAMPSPTPEPLVFDGEAAFAHVQAQMDIGDRPTGSEGSRRTADYIAEHLRSLGWTVEFQDYTYLDTPARNIIAKRGSGPIALIGAHYDTRRQADNDPDPALRARPVPGANDGASGVAVLLELARVLEPETLSHQVWLVFFDAEDNGRLDGWEFIAGSRYFAANLTETPEFVVIADMIGDADQRIYRERNSTVALQDRIWALAADLGYADFFIDEYKYSMLDDHTPFLERGIAAVDLIDFDYPYWHTTADTIDKVSPLALERVGRVIQTLLESLQ